MERHTFSCKSAQQAPPSRVLQGVRFRIYSLEQALGLLDTWARTPGPTKIAIANSHTLNLARCTPAYREILARFVVINDGVGVNIASRLRYGAPFPDNLNGTDLLPAFLLRVDRPLRVYLLGGKPAVVARAFDVARQSFPQHLWLGCTDGYFAATEEAAICERIHNLKPDLLLVAMGNPLQEAWIDRCATATGSRVCIGVGALFDFWAGAATRAPLWMRRANLEWLYRLLREPERLWRRYLVGNVTFLWAALKEGLGALRQ